MTTRKNLLLWTAPLLLLAASQVDAQTRPTTPTDQNSGTTSGKIQPQQPNSPGTPGYNAAPSGEGVPGAPGTPANDATPGIYGNPGTTTDAPDGATPESQTSNPGAPRTKPHKKPGSPNP